MVDEGYLRCDPGPDSASINGESGGHIRMAFYRGHGTVCVKVPSAGIHVHM